MSIFILLAALGISARFDLVAVGQNTRLFRTRCMVEKKNSKATVGKSVGRLSRKSHLLKSLGEVTALEVEKKEPVCHSQVQQ